jgi:DNA-binding ferritin-like protein (Dps family)
MNADELYRAELELRASPPPAPRINPADALGDASMLGAPPPASTPVAPAGPDPMAPTPSGQKPFDPADALGGASMLGAGVPAPAPTPVAPGGPDPIDADPGPLEGSGNTASDVVTAEDAGQAAKAVLRGIDIGAARLISNFIQTGADAVGAGDVSKGIDLFLKYLKTVGTPDDVPQVVGEMVGQFVVPAIGGITALVKAGVKPLVATLFTDSFIGFAGMNPDEANMASFIPEDSKAFGSLREVLATNPEDSVFYNRMRNLVEAVAMLGLGEGVMRAIPWAAERAARIGKSAGTTAVQRRRPLETQSGREPDISPDPLVPRLPEGTPVQAGGAESGVRPWFRLAPPDEPAVGRGIEDVSSKLARKGEPAPVFFSAVRNAVDAIPMEKGSASQMRAMIAKGEGVKAEEMAWTGLDDFLKGKKSVTKAEIKEYMDANQVRIEEVVKGTAPDKVQIRQAFQLQNQTGTELANAAYRSGMSKREVHRLSIQLERGEVLASELPEELQPLAFKYIGAFEDYTALKAGQATTTKFSEYTLPGGENYREVLLTLPEKSLPLELQGGAFAKAHGYELDKVLKVNTPEGEHWQRAIREARQDRSQRNFTGGHYDESNVLAHIRLNDRTGPNGERILFIEEIQSDWHQKGRARGYINPANVGKTEVFETTTMRVRAAFDTDEEARAFIREQADREGLDYAPHGQGILAGDLVPDAPLKKTWHETSLRRVIRMAAEEGYDTVAWTPGRMQADRYDLSKQVEEISYHASGNETSVILKGVKGISDQDLELVLDGEGIIKVTDFGAPDDWKGKHIEDVVGKDIAEKIMSGSGDYRRYQELNRKDIAGKLNNPEEIEEFSALAKRKLATSRKGSISGEGLQVGGEGMKAFYDKMLKKYASKFGKKFGAKVGTVEIIGGGNKPISFEEFIFVYPSDGPFELIDIANNPGLDRRMNEEYSKFLEGRKSDQVWNIPITKKMRESVLKKGVPLFSAAGAAAVATQDKKQPAI